jgi:hypothetical protein
MPFPSVDIDQWIAGGAHDCGIDPQLQASLGGTAFNVRDKTTYWTHSSQFFTWWKNNIERKSKFQSLVKDSKYFGADLLDSQRALYCKSVISLAMHIKSYFSKNRNTSLSLLPLPLPPPNNKQSVSSISPVTKSGRAIRSPAKASSLAPCKESFTSVVEIAENTADGLLDGRTLFRPIKPERSSCTRNTHIRIVPQLCATSCTDDDDDDDASKVGGYITPITMNKRKSPLLSSDDQQQAPTDQSFHFDFGEEDAEIGIIVHNETISEVHVKTDALRNASLLSLRNSEDCETSFSDSILAFSFDDLCSIVQSFGAYDIRDVNVEPLFRVEQQIDIRDGIDLMDCFDGGRDETDYYTISGIKRLKREEFTPTFDILSADDQAWV